MTCEVDGRRLEKNYDTAWLKKKVEIVLKKMQIDHNLTWRETIWLVEIDFFLGIQKVHNNDTSEMRNIQLD